MQPGSDMRAIPLVLLLASTPAMGLTLAEENFEDDSLGSFYPSLTGPPTNPSGTPGRWIANGYVVPTPWYDPKDADPDTNWNLRATSLNLGNLVGGAPAGKQAWFESWNLSGTPNGAPGNGSGGPAPYNGDRFARDGILQFTLADGTPRPAVTGETIRGEFQYFHQEGNALFSLVGSIPGLQSEQAADVYQGVGQPRGITTGFTGGAYSDFLSGEIAFNGGSNNVFTHSVIGNGSGNVAKVDLDPAAIPLAPFQGANLKFQKVVFEYTVGNSSYNYLGVDRNDGFGLREVRTASGGSRVPVGNTFGSLDGIVFGGGQQRPTAYGLDSIKVEIIGAEPPPPPPPPPVSHATRFSEHLIKNGYSYAYGLASGDLDGDGDLDLTSTNVRGSVQQSDLLWFENDGQGSFQQHTAYQGETGWLERHAIGDIDGDNRLDAVVVQNRDGHVLWYNNNGPTASSPWQRKVITTNAPRAYDVALADLDSDGKLDIAVAGYSSNQVSWFPNPGAAGWGSEWNKRLIDTSMSETRTIRAADFNGDGRVDLFAAAVGASNVPVGADPNTHASRVVWYENSGQPSSPTFIKHVIDQDSRAPIHGEPADMDGDDDIDVVMAFGMRSALIPVDYHEVAWYENIGGEGLQWEKYKIGDLSYAFEAVASDIDGDNDMDVVASSWARGDRVVWFENLGDPRGDWLKHVLKEPWPAANQVIVADLNGDGWNDVAGTADDGSSQVVGANELRWWRNEGYLGDFNRDRLIDSIDIDLLCAAIRNASPTVPYDVNEDGQVTSADLAFHVESILGTHLGDTDTDGDVDLSDLSNLAGGYGQPNARWATGDTDGDGDVDLNDLATLSTYYGLGEAQAYADFASLAAVPEPAGAIFLGLIGVIAVRRRISWTS